MWKKSILAIVAVFIAWSILDYIIHPIILGESYRATAQLWRPMGEMKMGLMYFVSLIHASAFVVLYTLLVNPKSSINGLKYGALYGLGMGISMGYGMYSVMPLPYKIAFVWFWGILLEISVAGFLVGLIVKKE